MTGSRTGTSYPSFSKEHSKEAVGPRSNFDLFTPPSTDVNASKEKLANLNRIINSGPPSPPLTDKNVGKTRDSPKKPAVDTIAEEKQEEDEVKPSPRLHPRVDKSNGRPRVSSHGTAPAAKLTTREKLTTSRPNISNDPRRTVSQTTRTASPVSPEQSNSTDNLGSSRSAFSSNATSIAPEQPSMQRPGSKIPMQPLHEESYSPQILASAQVRQQTPLETSGEPASALHTPSSSGGPPPPPPPPAVPASTPRVDYLLQYGGLDHNIPKNLLYAGKPMVVQQGQCHPSQPTSVAANLFEPYNQLLADFEKVVSKNGSLAVATGYRSVARRLLDRLEAVFARDISSEQCACRMCAYDNDSEIEIMGVSWGEILELVSGRRDLPSWPPFTLESAPPADGLGITTEQHEPMQKLDIDVPEEYKEHYIRQSQQTKKSVDRWLNRQSNDSAAQADEVDDETLTFAILTHIPADQRPLFKALLGIVDVPLAPPNRAPSPERRNLDATQRSIPRPTPAPPRHRSPYLIAASVAIQRLYRLSQPPRDSEVALYLLNNPTLHHPLATLAAISNDEWEILISGRFDGFLRSGAEDVQLYQSQPSAGYGPQQPAYGGSRAPSRGATPAYNSRARQNSAAYFYPPPQQRPASAPGCQPRYQTPTSHSAHDSGKTGAPIALDEETELQTLSEIERDIYTSMETLEDAFEQLHLRAEAVRKTIRDRSAGLAAAAAQRRRSTAPIVREATPFNTADNNNNNGGGIWRPTSGMSGNSFFGIEHTWDVEAETDDGLGDGSSELAPDDSASQVIFAKRRRKKRQKDRGTPVVEVIDEDDEFGDEASDSLSPSKEDTGARRGTRAGVR